MKKYHPRTISVLFVFASLLTVLAGWVIGALYRHWSGDRPDYWSIIGLTWLVMVGAPALFVSREGLLTMLGQRKPPGVTANTPSLSGREIPVHGVGGDRSVFMSVLGWFQSSPAPEPISPAPLSYTVTLDGLAYTVTHGEIEEFLNIAWRKQGQGQAGFSRTYWTRKRRPALKREQYEARMRLIESAGLVIDRDERRSGRMACSPSKALELLRGLP